MTAFIRAARPEDGTTLREIERLAGERFRDFGLPGVADAEPASVATLAAYARAGRSWVAVGLGDGSRRSASDGTVVGYVLVDIIDAQAHIEQISVLPDHQGTGVGRALIDRVAQWARGDGRSALTLTTFATIPWNGPLYAHLGFVTLPESALGPQLRALRLTEAAHGLDPAQRVCMRLALEP
jgi:GNAT superfamily N-acetyltransferase